MNKIKTFGFRFRQNFILFVGVCLSVYFSYHAVLGERSYAHLLGVEQRLRQEKARFDDVDSQKDAVESRVVMLRPGSLSLDLLEERARIVLGYEEPEDIAIVGN